MGALWYPTLSYSEIIYVYIFLCLCLTYRHFCGHQFDDWGRCSEGSP